MIKRRRISLINQIQMFVCSLSYHLERLWILFTLYHLFDNHLFVVDMIRISIHQQNLSSQWEWKSDINWQWLKKQNAIHNKRTLHWQNTSLVFMLPRISAIVLFTIIRLYIQSLSSYLSILFSAASSPKWYELNPVPSMIAKWWILEYITKALSTVHRPITTLGKLLKGYEWGTMNPLSASNVLRSADCAVLTRANTTWSWMLKLCEQWYYHHSETMIVGWIGVQQINDIDAA